MDNISWKEMILGFFVCWVGRGNDVKGYRGKFGEQRGCGWFLFSMDEMGGLNGLYIY